MQQPDIDSVKIPLDNIAEQLVDNQATKPVESQFVREYREFFAELQLQASQRQASCIQLILGSGISYHPEEQFEEDIEIKVANHSAGHDILELELTHGFFTLKDITVIVIDSPFPSHLAGHEGYGSYGKVYKVKLGNQINALKATYFQKDDFNNIVPDELAMTLKLFLREYCMSKIASVLGVGPRISSQMGFDILIYNDCIAYAMEYCETYHNSNRKPNFTNSLKQKLLKLHALNFIHLDIKLENVCFSTLQNDFILIDYGFSKFVPQPFGEKTFTQFYGTSEFCCPAMNQLLTNEKPDYVDLYYNDMYCLSKTYKTGKEFRNLDDIYLDEEETTYLQFSASIRVHYLKYLAHKFKMTEFQANLKQISSQLKPAELSQLIQFIKRMNFTGDVFSLSLYISKKIRFLQEKTDNQYFSTRKSLKFYENILQALEKSNAIDLQKQYGKRGILQVKGRGLLLNWEVVIKQDWQNYLKMLVKYIQINSKMATFEDKVMFCRVARQLLSKGYMADVAVIEKSMLNVEGKNENDLEYISRILFRFCLSESMDDLKVKIFHRIIYNVVILELFDFEQILSSYKSIQFMEMEFIQKMHMLLKFKTTLLWKKYECKYQVIDKIDKNNVQQRINEMDEHFEKQYSNQLSIKQKLLIKAMKIKLNQSRESMTFFQESYRDLITKNGLSSYTNNSQFIRDATLWMTSILIVIQPSRQAAKSMESFIFREGNKSQQTFEYYHFIIIFSSNALSFSFIDRRQLIANFNQIFAQCEKVSKKYNLTVIDQIILLKNRNYTNFERFLRVIKEQIDLSLIAPFSLLGNLIGIELCSIISWDFIKLTPEFQSFIRQHQPLCIRYIYKIEESTQLLFSNIIAFVREEMFTYKLKPAEYLTQKLTHKFHYIYSQCKQSVMKIKSKRKMNYCLLCLNVMTMILIFRNKKFLNSMKLITYIMRITEILHKNSDAPICLRSLIYTLCFRYATTEYIRRKNNRQDTIFVRKKMVQFVLQEKNYMNCLRQNRFLYILIMYLMFYEIKKLGKFINQLSRCILGQNQQKLSQKYYSDIYSVFWSPVVKYQRLQVALKDLEPVEINPYNAIFLHLCTSIQKFRTRSNLFQVSKGFSLMHHAVTSMAISDHYKSIFEILPRPLSHRRFRHLVKNRIKLEKAEKTKLAQFFIMRTSEQARKRFENPVFADKLKAIKSKISDYYIRINH